MTNDRQTYDRVIEASQAAINLLYITTKIIEAVSKQVEAAQAILRIASSTDNVHVRENVRAFFNEILQQIDQIIDDSSFDNGRFPGLTLLDGGVGGAFDPMFDLRVDFAGLVPGVIDVRSFNLNTLADSARPGSTLDRFVPFDLRSSGAFDPGAEGNAVLDSDLQKLADYCAGMSAASGVLQEASASVRLGNQLARDALQDFLVRDRHAGEVIDGTEDADLLAGGNGSDCLFGGNGHDSLNGGAGADSLSGGAGVDTAIFSGARSDYAMAKSGGGYVITDLRSGSPDGVDTLTGVERIRFGAATMSAEAFTPVNFNGDLRSDLLWCNTGGLAVTFLMNGTAVTSASAIGSANGANWRVRTTGDLNGDGASDLIWQDTGGLVTAFVMNGSSIATAAVIGNATAAFRVVGSGDLNGDGNSDIILQNGNGQAVGWLMDGTGIIGAGTIGGANGASWSVEAVGDLNGDGLSDLVWQDTDGRTTGWLMNGLSVTSGALLAGANGASFSVRGIGDLNGDSTADIVWQFSNGQAGAWLMNGLTIAGAGAIGGANGGNVQIRDVADLNGDGLMDLVWQDVTNGQAIGFLMNGTAITSAGLIGGANGADWFIV